LSSPTESDTHSHNKQRAKRVGTWEDDSFVCSCFIRRRHPAAIIIIKHNLFHLFKFNFAGGLQLVAALSSPPELLSLLLLLLLLPR